MTDQDFASWLKHHFANFTAAAGWLGKFPLKPRFDGDPVQRDVVDAWRRTLREVALADAVSASDALASGDESFSEKTGFDHHPRDIRRICRGHVGERLSKDRSAGYIRRFDGQPTFRCPKCRDEGLRFAIHPRSVAAAREIFVTKGGSRICKLHHPTLNPEGNEPLYSCVLACSCEAGYRWRSQTRLWSDADAEWNLGSEENYEAAQRAAEGRRDAEAASYAFNPDDWTYSTPDDF